MPREAQGILPLVSLGFIKALVDYIRPEEDQEKKEDTIIKEETEKTEEEIQVLDSPQEEIKDSPEIKKTEEKSRKLKDTVYYDLDPTKIT